MKKWTINKRIIAGFGSLLVLVAVLAGTSIFLLRQIDHQGNILSGDALPGMNAITDIRVQIGEIQQRVLRTLLARTPEERKQLQAEVGAMRETTLKAMADYEKSIHVPEDREMFGELTDSRDKFVAARTRLFELINTNQLDEAVKQYTETVAPAYARYQAAADKMLRWNVANANSASGQSEQIIDRAMAAIPIVSVVVFALSIVFAVLIAIGLNRALKGLAGSLSDGAVQVSSAAGQVSSASQTLAEGASEQAASLEETSSSLEEISSMTQRNTENAQKANALAKEARQSADKGVEQMRSMSAAMSAIKSSSDDIAKIIKTIDEVAFQTNILALNAAVEAARAGEAGMGFAVVADEVRNLAQRCAQAAKETSSKIEGAILKAAQGVEISSKVGGALDEIVAKARQVDELVAEVASASREQTQGITQVNTAVSQMDKVTQSNAASAEESASAAEELNAQATGMNESVKALLHLVGGGKSPAQKGAESRSPKAKPVFESRPAAPRAAHTNGKAGGNGKANGTHLQKSAPAKLTARDRSQIPMEGDFKDF